jgi:hypothetical protein
VTKSAFAGNLDAVQVQLTRFLKPLGYRKRGRIFDRDAGKGMPQVINPRMAGYPDLDDQES